MAGYGNRTAPDYTAESHPHLSEQHSNTRFGSTSTSPPTYGAGFGNKRVSLTPSTSEEKSVDEENLHFDTQETHGSAPYSNAHTYGSASTAGAGYGNKTGSFTNAAEGEKKDSTMGKVMQKVGGILHSLALTKKGQAKREDAPAKDGQDVHAPTAS
ncbi:hypothetical protein EJ07DRAFT_181508 [Lizonia empirigonia]|nr:hypothetical protein EJ07DRAFT_181508 [Lizonia empirigonia]